MNGSYPFGITPCAESLLKSIKTDSIAKIAGWDLQAVMDVAEALTKGRNGIFCNKNIGGLLSNPFEPATKSWSQQAKTKILEIEAQEKARLVKRGVCFESVKQYVVRFDSKHAEPRDDSRLALDEVARIFNKHCEQLRVRLEVRGYTDQHNAMGRNERLSQERAQSVANHLVKEGKISRTLICWSGCGEARSGNDEADRHVEFAVGESAQHTCFVP